MCGIIGFADYQIYRLRQDAYLDDDVENAWNCVTIPNNSNHFSG